MDKKRLTGRLRDSVESSVQARKNKPVISHIKGCIYSVIKPGEMGYYQPWSDECPACDVMRDIKEDRIDEEKEFSDG